MTEPNGSNSWFAKRLAALGGTTLLAKSLPFVALAGAALIVAEGVVVFRRMRKRRKAEAEARRVPRQPDPHRIFEEEEGDAMR